MFSILLFIACPGPIATAPLDTDEGPPADACTAAPGYSFSDQCVQRTENQCYDPVFTPSYLAVHQNVQAYQQMIEKSHRGEITCAHTIVDYCDAETIVLGEFSGGLEPGRGEVVRIVTLTDQTQIGMFEYYFPDGEESEVFAEGTCTEAYLGDPAYESCAREAARYLLDTRMEYSLASSFRCDLDACNRINFP